MNITHTQKFQSRTAALEGARSNLSHMMFLFWQDNVRPGVAINRTWAEDTKEAIDEWLADHAHPTILEASNFICTLVDQTKEKK